jgi:hypothetical protein
MALPFAALVRQSGASIHRSTGAFFQLKEGGPNLT